MDELEQWIKAEIERGRKAIAEEYRAAAASMVEEAGHVDMGSLMPDVVRINERLRRATEAGTRCWALVNVLGQINAIRRKGDGEDGKA